MKHEIVQLVNVPEVHEHRVDTANVKSIFVEELQIGEIVLFGFNLLLIQGKVKMETPPDMPDTYNVNALNLSHGIASIIGYPEGTVFLRVLEAKYSVKAGEDAWEAYQNFKRMRRPIIGEQTRCGICFGDSGAVTELEIQRFDEEIDSDKGGSLWKCYNAEMDVFQAYDGCEDQDPRL